MTYATPLTPERMSGTLLLNVNKIHCMIPKDQKNVTTQSCTKYTVIY